MASLKSFMTWLSAPPALGRHIPLPLVLLAATLVTTGCATSRPFGGVNLQEPGWTVQKGQAIWRPRAGAPELVGDLLIARHDDGRSFVQFIKVPFPSVTAWRNAAAWQIEYQPQNRRFSARSHPPVRCLMLHVAAATQAPDLPAALAMEKTGTNAQQWRLWPPTCRHEIPRAIALAPAGAARHLRLVPSEVRR
jgi:hypothetical protein